MALLIQGRDLRRPVQMQAIQVDLDRLGSELDAIEQSLVIYAPEVLAMAGAVVSLDHQGGAIVHRGLLRPTPGQGAAHAGPTGARA